MKQLVAVLLLVLPALLFAADDPSRELTLLSSDLRTLARVTDLAKDLDDNKQVLTAIVTADIDTLRGPRDDGTYRYASLQRDEASRVTEEVGVQRVHSEEQLDSGAVSAKNAFRLMVTVPKKRNLVAANQRVYVKDAVVEWTGFDGKTTRDEIKIDVWVNPGDSHGVALADIARSARATVRLGVDSGAKKAAAEIALLQAKLVDDPASPWYPAVSRLLDLQRLLGEEKIRRGDLKSSIDEAILTLPGELEKRMAAQAATTEERKVQLAGGVTSGTIAPGDATSDVVLELRAIDRLSGGTLEEQTEARTRMKELIQKLVPQQ